MGWPPAGRRGIAACGSGAAYVFSVPCGGPITSFGSGCAGSGGFTPSLDVVGCAGPRQEISVQISAGLGGSPALLAVGTQPASIPLGGGCSLLVGPTPILISGLVLAGAGAGQGSLSFPATLGPNSKGATILVQAAVLDPGSPILFTVTNRILLGIQ